MKRKPYTNGTTEAAMSNDILTLRATVADLQCSVANMTSALAAATSPTCTAGIKIDMDGEPLFTVGEVTIGTVKDTRDFLAMADNEPETTVSAENRLVGEWLEEQKTAGVLSISMSELDTVRTGIRLALG